MSATVIVALALLAPWDAGCLLGAYIVATVVLALPLIGYLVPSMGTRFPWSLTLVTLLAVEHLGQIYLVVLERWMEWLPTLPLVMPVLALLLDLLRLVRRGAREPSPSYSRVRPAMAACLLIPALLFWIVEVLNPRFASLSPLWLGASWLVLYVAAGEGLLRGGAAVRRRYGGRGGALAGIVVVATVVPIWGFWTEAHEPTDPQLSPYGHAHEIRAYLDIYYPHWDTARVDIDELWGEHRDRALAQAVACTAEDEPCLGVLRTLRDLYAELDNGHTEIVIDGDLGWPRVSTRPVTDGLVIDFVAEGSEAERLGLREGMEVIAVDGRSVDETAERLPPWLSAAVSQRTRNYAARLNLLVGPPGKTIALTVVDDNGYTRTVELTRELPTSRQDEDSWIESELDDEGWAYIYLGGFNGQGLVRRFDRALDRAIHAPGLILDLRGNGGGLVTITKQILGRFFESPIQLSNDCSPSEFEDEDFVCEEQWVEPRGVTFRGALAVLVDEEVASAGEVTAYALCRLGDARCFGRTTSGETDYVSTVDIPGAEIRFSTWDFRPVNGPSLLGKGLTPHEVIELEIADFRNDEDPTFEAARRWLEQEIVAGSASQRALSSVAASR